MKGFWAIPKSIAKRKDLSFRAKLVAGILWTRKNSDFEAFPSRKYIAEALGVSKDTVDRAIKELKEKAGLKVERKGLRKNNRYYIPDWEAAELRFPESATLQTLESADLQTPIVRDNIERNTVVDAKASFIPIILNYFREIVGETRGFVAEIDYAKDGKLVKQRLKNYSPDELKDLIKWYLRSEISDRLGISLSACLSAHVINLWKNEKSKRSLIEKLYPVWQRDQRTEKAT